MGFEPGTDWPGGYAGRAWNPPECSERNSASGAGRGGRAGERGVSKGAPKEQDTEVRGADTGLPGKASEPPPMRHPGWLWSALIVISWFTFYGSLRLVMDLYSLIGG